MALVTLNNRSLVNADVGTVLQVVTATDSTERSTTSTSYVTGSNTLSVAITPSSSSNKIYITSTFEAGTSDTGNTSTLYTLYRGSTNLSANIQGFSRIYFSGLGTHASQINQSIQILDSPNTTSATTYQIYMKGIGGNTLYFNKSGVTGSITAMEIAG